jgi:hypothetical protein
MDFRRVLVTDRLSNELFAAAAKDNLLFLRSRHTELPPVSGGLARQRALSLLVLFDQILIHEDGLGELRIPDLEQEGIVKIISATGPSDGDVSPLVTTWKKSDPRGFPPKALLQSLARVRQLRPIVANRIMGISPQFASFVAKKAGTSRRVFIEQLLDYATAYVQGQNELMQEHPLNQFLPKSFLKSMKKDLFCFEEPLNAANALLLSATMVADEIATITELSAIHMAPVATENYGKVFRSAPSLKGKAFDAVCAANRFLILQCALSNREPCMPHIDSIKHALSLRKNPYLKAMREHLRILNGGLTVGDSAAIAEAAREIQRARHALNRRAIFDKPLAWLSYMSVPAAVVQPLLGNSILGMSVGVIGAAGTVIGAAGTFASRRIQRKNEWALFGR